MWKQISRSTWDVNIVRRGQLVSVTALGKSYGSSTYQERSRRPSYLRSSKRLRSEPRHRTQPQPSLPSKQRFWEEVKSRPINDTQDKLQLLLSRPTLIITRQLEMLNIFVGFEQSNKYAVNDEHGQPVGFIAEQSNGLFQVFSRQLFRTHRPFDAVLMDTEGLPLLFIYRPFSWINSRMFLSRPAGVALADTDGDPKPLQTSFAEVQQRWHFWRRRYDLFLRNPHGSPANDIGHPPNQNQATEIFSQFASVDSGLFAWHFSLSSQDGREIASIDRAFRGFGREIFTDTGEYTISFPSSSVSREMTVEEKALVLGLAVNIDVDYFSRHSDGRMGGSMWWSSESWD